MEKESFCDRCGQEMNGDEFGLCFDCDMEIEDDE